MNNAAREWQRKADELRIRVNRLFLKTGGQGPAWERLEALVAELEPEEV